MAQIKTCPICNKTFIRANTKYCFDCMPTGLPLQEQRKIKARLDRIINPIIQKCPICQKNFELPYGEVNRKYCFNCIPKGIPKTEWANIIHKENKKIALKMLGGKCYLCGFDKYTSALEFHHYEEQEKDFNISNKINGKIGLDNNVINELNKCIILCSNCHRALHGHDLDITEEELKEKIEKEKIIYDRFD